MRNNVTSLRINILIILTSITTLTWFGFELFNYYAADTVTPEIKELITPLEGNLKITVLDEIENKNSIPAFTQPSEVINFNENIITDSIPNLNVNFNGT